MSFTLFRRPGAVAILDDDPDYLEMLALALPRHWQLKLFLRPAELVAYLQQESHFWEADAWNQQSLIEQWRSGKPLIPQLLRYWARYDARYGLTRVCVVDYAMPVTNGIQALGELVDWPGARILLTGQADEQVAVKAFNAGLIDQFIAKQTPELMRRLVETLERLLDASGVREAQAWRTTLSPAQRALLRPAGTLKWLDDLASRRWVEYVTIGDPFGVLGMTDRGAVEWLQLEPVAGLGDLATLAEGEGVGISAAADIRAGRRLVDLDLRQALERNGSPELAIAWTVGEGNSLLSALFTIDASLCPALENSYSQWLSRNGDRSVRK